MFVRKHKNQFPFTFISPINETVRSLLASQKWRKKRCVLPIRIRSGQTAQSTLTPNSSAILLRRCSAWHSRNRSGTGTASSRTRVETSKASRSIGWFGYARAYSQQYCTTMHQQLLPSSPKLKGSCMAAIAGGRGEEDVDANGRLMHHACMHIQKIKRAKRR